MRVLSLCDRSGVMVRPWLDAGHTATIVDLQHPAGTHRDGPLTRVGADVQTWRPGSTFDIVFAFPPCTHLTNSGARWFKAKGLTALIEGLTLVEACRAICEAQGAPWMLENPVGQLSTYWRKPDYMFDPCDFGGYPGGEWDTYTKRTCLWTGNGFVMPSPLPIPTSGKNPIHFAPGGPGQADARSVTPAGFARAVFEANAVPVLV